MKFRWYIALLLCYLTALAGAILALAYFPDSAESQVQDAVSVIDGILQSPTIRLLVESLMFIP